jgi:hypothetical protein
MREIPETFEWVKERNKCSAMAEFMALRLDAEKDVEVRNQQRQTELPNNQGQFKFTSNSDQRFVVFFDTMQNPFLDHKVPVIFTLIDGRIEISKRAPGRDEAILMKLTPSLDESGKCMLKLGDRYFYRWQILKETLEPLFF